MAKRDRLTLLQQLMRERRWTRSDTLKRLAVRAPSVGADDFALSMRQLDRMLAGQVQTLPYPSTCRVIEAEFGRPIEHLLAFVGELPGTGEVVGPNGAGVTAVTSDDPLVWDIPGGGGLSSEDMNRRLLLTSTVGLAFAGGAPGANKALETLRTQLTQSVASTTHLDLDVSEWDAVAWEYGQSYLTTPPSLLLSDLAVELADLWPQINRERNDSRKHDLSRVAAQLAAVMAMSLVNLGNTRAANRWWRTARYAADAAGDASIRVWTRGEEGVRALYAHHGLSRAVDLADEALAIGGTTYAAQALAAKAQALALLGRADDARATVEMIEPIFTKTPATVTGDEASVYGWPQSCLRHAESFVYSHLGLADEASRAQQQALALYPTGETRSRALVHLHEALCQMDFDIDAGSHHAAHAISSLPVAQRTTMILHIGHRIVMAVPERERARPSVAGLREALAVPQGPHNDG